MMTLRLNNQTMTVSEHCSLADLLTQQGHAENYFAVSLNRCFVPRLHYATTLLKPNDEIEIVMPMQGG